MADFNRTPEPGDNRGERIKDKAFGKHDDNPGVADHVGEAAGGISGTVAGAALGSAIGPVGTILGGIVGAMGGWWAGRSLAEAATAITGEDETYYRRHFDTRAGRFGNRTYDEVKPAYYVGHLASRNPDYRNRSFEDIETDLSRGWTSDRNRGSWDDVRGFAAEGYSRGRSRLSTVAGGLADRIDDTKDRMDGNPASRPGIDRTDRPERSF
ncbi:MAG TPA: hypothetical protein VFS56_00745 [Gemmatimonadaceae bacterium]|nr:hypothetical protein [Gemmatimonadaceae bacterium]